jgi:3-phenylpropionate/trans-cinnamate dioxygenase ferredoxin subunit
VAKYVVARVDDVPEMGNIVVEVNGREIGIFRVHGEFYGLLNRCPHRGGPMCKGQMVSTLRSERPGHYQRDDDRVFVECPWHGWEFEVSTGQSYFDPVRTRIRPYPVEVAHGDEVATAVEHEAETNTHLLPGPYIAETIPVSVEDDYIVVTTR